MKKIRLGVNIDHVATVRNARGENYPSPLKAAIIAYRKRKGREIYLSQKLQTESNMRNQNFVAEHPCMELLADCVGSRLAPFTTTEALIDSELREKERVRDIDLKKASECLQSLGYRKDKHQTQGDAGKKRYWRENVR